MVGGSPPESQNVPRGALDRVVGNGSGFVAFDKMTQSIDIRHIIEVVDVGTDVSPESFVEAIRKEEPGLLGMSALLTTTMPNMEKTIEALVEAGLRDQVKVMIGGAPITQQYADSIGADGYAADASRAVSVTKSILG